MLIRTLIIIAMSSGTMEDLHNIECSDLAYEREVKEGRLDKVEKKIKTSFQSATKKVESLKRKVITHKEVQKMAKKFEELMEKQGNPSFLIKLDEIKFTFGIISMFFTFAVIFYPNVSVLAFWVTFINMVLLVIRFFEYRSKQWHYFYFDYCYFVNLSMWIYVLFLPKNIILFYMSGMNALGPILNYFFIFKHKLIYQSREAVTSFTMHYTPALFYWVLFHHNHSNDSRFLSKEEIRGYLLSNGLWSQAWVFFLGFSFYAGWMLFYYLMIFKFRKNRIAEKKYLTLYSYTVDDLKYFNKLILKFGPELGPITFCLLHLTQGFIGIVFSMVFINSSVLICIGLLIYLIFPIWNSSVYYFEYFSKDYHTKVSRRATNFKEKRMKKRSHSNDSVAQPTRKFSEEVKPTIDTSSPELNIQNN